MLVATRFREQLGRYLRILAWMLQDAFRRRRGRIIVIVVASVCGVLLQGGVLGIVMAYASRLQENRVIDIGGWVLEPRSGLAYGLVGATSLVLLFLSAVLIYMAKWRVAAASVDYEEICARRSLLQMGGRPMIAAPALGYGQETILQGMNYEQTANPMLCGRSLGTVLSGTHPLIMAVYMSLFLLYIDPRLTLLLALMLAGFLVGHYRLNVFVVENESHMRRARPAFRRLLSAMTSQLMALNAPVPVISRQVDSGFAAPEIRELYDRVSHRRMAVARSDFLSNVMIALSMALVVIYLGHQALIGATPWGEMVVYIVALRFAATGIRNVLNAITSYARFYPGLRAHYELVNSLRAPGADTAVTLVNRRRCGDVDRMRLGPGDRAAIVSPVTLSRYGLFYFSQVLTGCRDEAGRLDAGEADFVPARPALPQGLAIGEYLGVGESGDWDSLGANAGDPELVQRVREAAERVARLGLPGPRTSEAVEVYLLAARLRKARALVVSARALRLLPPEIRERWMEAFRDRVLFIHYRKSLKAAGGHGEKVVIAGNRAGQCALASPEWLSGHRALVRRRLRAQLPRGQGKPGVGELVAIET